MKTLALVGSILLASVSVADIQSGDIVQIGDYQYVVLSKSDYDKLWVVVSDLKAKWEAMNKPPLAKRSNERTLPEKLLAARQKRQSALSKTNEVTVVKEVSL